MLELMIDIETLGTKPGCGILQIGACTFDRETFHVKHTFEQTITAKSLDAHGFTASPSTAAWWAMQPEAARKAVFEDPKAVDVQTAMGDFMAWNLANLPYTTTVWSQGHFDVPIMEFALQKFNVMSPWNFWMQRDTRTAYDALGLTRETIKAIPRLHQAHTALGDALHQVHCLKVAFDVGRNRQGKWAS